MNRERILDFLIKNYGKLIGVAIGLIFSILTISIGIIKTIFIFLCVYGGYYFGDKIDKKERIEEVLDKILPLGKFK